MSRPRFSLRQVILLLFVLALLLGGERMLRARRDRLARAAECRQEEAGWRRTQHQLERRLARGRDANRRYATLSDEDLRLEMDRTRDVAENHRLWADHYLNMARWYERGAARFWETLGPEPELPPDLSGGGTE